VKAPIASLELSNGARTGLTGAIAVIARKAVRSNVTINNILPGPFDTDRLRGTSKKMAEMRGVPLEQVTEERKKVIPAGRFGNTEEFGAAAAFLCSQHGGFITGQNLLLDGGIFPGSM
jgi:3-oxoacyl-[acyl-carrier protein] reductase